MHSQAELWNRYMTCYDFLTQIKGYDQNLQDLVQAIGPRLGQRVLDAGSGTGNLSIQAKKAGAVVTSLDYSESAIAIHRQKDPEARIHHASLENALPFEDMEFEAVCCASVLFALSPQGCRRALAEFHRVIRVGGRLIVTVPARSVRLRDLVRMHVRTVLERHGMVMGSLQFLRTLPALSRVLYYNRKLFYLPDWHGYHRFSETELTDLINQAGFEDLQVSRTYGGCFLMVKATRASNSPIPVAKPARVSISQ